MTSVAVIRSKRPSSNGSSSSDPWRTPVKPAPVAELDRVLGHVDALDLAERRVLDEVAPRAAAGVEDARRRRQVRGTQQSAHDVPS